MNYVLFDGQHHQKLKPLTLTRPVADLRVGIFKIHEKWSNFLNKEISIRCKDYLSDKFNSHTAKADIGVSAAVMPNSELCEAIDDLDENTIMMKDGQVIAIKPLPIEDDNMSEELNKYRVLKYSGTLHVIDRPMDIFLLNGDQISSDLKFINTDKLATIDNGNGNLIIGNQVYIEKGAKVVGATLNSNEGPIYIGKNSEIMEGSNIRGPFVLMEGSTVKMGAKIYGPTTIGPQCKVGGELGNVVFQGYANKAHDGYLGNSVIGYWCNLGADTNTSNLKNNYADVKSYSYNTDNFESTGTMYCGLILGDHSKSSINTMFNTGSVVGAFVNVFDSGFPPKFIPSFSWGGKSGFEGYNFDKAMEVAKVVMLRRGEELDEQTYNIYKSIFTIATDK
jgi:UDP-N-acetylglucosamine diphosphorylase/glucosamine-1-phosphate N-acetyltransferase